MLLHRPDENDVVLDADTRDEVVAEETELGEAALKDRLKALRAELMACTKERDEHLAGWQRAKADLVNFRRTVEEDRVRDVARARVRTIRALVPVFDSLEGAMSGAAWNALERTWREGMERVTKQLADALAQEGVVAFGTVGDPFDPAYHECVSVVAAEDAATDHTVAQVLQRGYRVGTEVVRPAKVVVFQTKATHDLSTA